MRTNLLLSFYKDKTREFRTTANEPGRLVGDTPPNVAFKVIVFTISILIVKYYLWLGGTDNELASLRS